MRNLFKLFGVIALAAIIGFSFAACSGSNDSEGDNSGSGGGGGGGGGDGKLAVIIYSFVNWNDEPKEKHEATITLSTNDYKQLRYDFINGYNGVALDSNTSKWYKNGELVNTGNSIAVINGTASPPLTYLPKISVQDGDKIKFQCTAYDFLKGNAIIGTLTAESTIVIK